MPELWLVFDDGTKAKILAIHAVITDSRPEQGYYVVQSYATCLGFGGKIQTELMDGRMVTKHRDAIVINEDDTGEGT